MNIIIPMAGKGERFQVAGYSTPKPFILIEDKPLYAWAIEGLPLEQASNLVFVLLETSFLEPIVADIKKRYADHNTHFCILKKETQGQAISEAKGCEHLDPEEPLLIHNNDTIVFHDKSTWSNLIKKGIDGGLLVFPGNEDRWCYSSVDKNGLVTRVAEKECISQWASAGTYFFSSTQLYMEALKDTPTDKGEFYIGPMFNTLIRKGHKVHNVIADKVFCFGIPEDLTSNIHPFKNFLSKTGYLLNT